MASRELGLPTWGRTGPAPLPLEAACNTGCRSRRRVLQTGWSRRKRTFASWACAGDLRVRHRGGSRADPESGAGLDSAWAGKQRPRERYRGPAGSRSSGSPNVEVGPARLPSGEPVRVFVALIFPKGVRQGLLGWRSSPCVSAVLAGEVGVPGGSSPHAQVFSGEVDEVSEPGPSELALGQVRGRRGFP